MDDKDYEPPEDDNQGPGLMDGGIDALLRDSGLKIAVMESCTGGLLAHVLTNLSNCGDYFLGGVISYATEIKELMGVNPAVIREHGVVSAETAIAMAQTIRDLFKTDVGLGITGVAGPKPLDGMPVGTVFVGIAGARDEEAQRFDLGNKGLDENKKQAVNAALQMLSHFVRQGDAKVTR